MGLDAMILMFWKLSFKLDFHSRLLPSSRGSLVPLFSAIRVVSSAYMRLLIFFLAILILTCDSSSPAFHIMYSAYKLNKQDGDIQPWHTSFPIFKQSIVLCPIVTVASWLAWRFLRRQVMWSGISISLSFPQFVVIYTVVWSQQTGPKYTVVDQKQVTRICSHWKKRKLWDTRQYRYIKRMKYWAGIFWSISPESEGNFDEIST